MSGENRRLRRDGYADHPEWLVRFTRPDGAAIGAGLLVDEQHVITCAHVLLGALADRVEELIEIGFPFVPGQPERLARAINIWPIDPKGAGDVAVLELVDQVAPTAITAPLRRPPRLAQRRVSVYGFPGGEPAARECHGFLGRASGAAGEWVQFDTDTAGWTIEPGFSGGPVWDEQAQAVVGIVSMYDRHRTGHVLPVSYLAGLWPELGEQIGWRLDLDEELDLHWLPRARGVEPEAERDGWFFTGRTAAVNALRTWLADEDQPALAIVSGGPGTGKSALLAHLLVAADSRLSLEMPGEDRIDFGEAAVRFDVAIHAKDRTFPQVASRIAAALDVDLPLLSDGRKPTEPTRISDQLLYGIRQHERPFTLMVDALDEAVSVEDGRRIATFLRRVTSLPDSHRIRVLVGIRTAPAGTSKRRVHEALYGEALRVDLQDARYLQPSDVVEYARRRLLSGHADAKVSPYRQLSDKQVTTIARAVATRNRYNFLVTQLTCRWLTSRPLAVEAEHEVLHSTFPATVGEALDRYLDDCAPTAVNAVGLLTALAFAHGEGLPRGGTWLAIANALDPIGTYTPSDLVQVFESAASYLVERGTAENGEPLYRLFHEALDEHLRARCSMIDPERAITDRLLKTVPASNGRRMWARADSYVIRHLATHAELAGGVDDLLTDADYLVHAAQQPLLPVLEAATTKGAQLSAAVYRTSHHRHAGLPPEARRQVLALDAARWGDQRLLDQLNRPDKEAGQWSAQWCTASSPLAVGLVATMRGHDAPVRAIAMTDLDGKKIAVTGADDGMIRLWDLATRSQFGEAIDASTERVNALAVVRWPARQAIVACGSDGRVRAWELRTQVPEFVSDAVHPPSPALAVAIAEVDDGPVAVTAWRDGSVRLWSPDTGRWLPPALSGHRGPIRDVSVTSVSSCVIAVTCGSDGTIRFWELARRRQIGVPAYSEGSAVSALAITDHAEGPVLLTGGEDGDIRVWDVRSREPLGAHEEGHRGESCPYPRPALTAPRSPRPRARTAPSGSGTCQTCASGASRSAAMKARSTSRSWRRWQVGSWCSPAATTAACGSGTPSRPLSETRSRVMTRRSWPWPLARSTG